MKKQLAFLAGIFFLMMVGSAQATTYECDSCADCSDKLYNYGNITLNASIVLNCSETDCSSTNWCIGQYSYHSIDCNGHSITTYNASGYYPIGIWMNGWWESIIINCTIDNFHWGFFLDINENTTIIDTTIRDSTIGIYFGDNACDVLGYPDVCTHIIENVTFENNSVGVKMGDSGYTYNVTIRDSLFRKNAVGIFLSNGYDAYNNYFYNNFFNNTNNIAIYATGNNSWNTTLTNGTNIVGGSQIGGNYWAYPNGTGYSQTCANANNDSFCDDPYTFNPTDYLPLTLNEPLNLIFVSPTPANNTLQSSRSFIANVSGSEALDTCTLTVNSTYNYSMTISGNYAYRTVTNLNDGAHTYYATCNGSVTNTTETRTLRIDGTPPTITIYSPQNITYNNISQVNLNVSASETINTWWHSINGGSNTTFTPNTTINVANGSNTLIVYANDTVGNIGSNSVSFTVNMPTSTTLNVPLNGIIIESPLGLSVNMSFNCSATNDIALSNISFYFSGGGSGWHLEATQNVTGIANTSIFPKTLQLGNYTWSCYACDYQDQCSWGVPNRTFTIQDTTPPTIDWNSPINNSITQNESFILWNVTLNDIPNVCFLEINGSGNISMVNTGYNCYYTTLNLTNTTTYCGLIYANDSLGNMNVSGMQCATINLTSEIPPSPAPEFRLSQILPYPFNLLAGIALGAGLILFIIGTLYLPELNLLDPKNLSVIMVVIVIIAALIAGVY